MRVAILQSCYIPWKGYFDIIGSSDVFVVYDDVQYSKNHWHNRNIIKGKDGPLWLTIPVSRSGGAFPNIETVAVAQSFAPRHWKTIVQCYARAPFFAPLAKQFEDLYAQAERLGRLSEVNFLFIEAISRMLGFRTEFVWSNSLAPEGVKSDRVLSICRQLGATSYLSGPSARSYLDVAAFADAGVEVKWMNYAGYPEYPQLHGAFSHQVSVIDLIFNTGDQARQFLKTGEN